MKDNAVLELWKARLQELTTLGQHKKLKSISDDYLRGSVKLAVANQKNYNERSAVKMPNFIKQLSVPATIHTLIAMPNMFSVQVFKGPDADMQFYLKKAGDLDSITAQPYKTTSQPNVLMKSTDELLAPDEVAYQCVELAVTMADDLVRHAVEDMLTQAKHQITSELHSLEGLLDAIKHASDTVKEAIGRPANFIVLPVTIARFMKSELATVYDFDALPINTRHVGCLKNRWSTYISSYEVRRILVGYRGTHPIDAGYIMCPARQFCDPKKEEKDRWLICRKTFNNMVRPDYYACIELTADKRNVSMDEF